MEELKPCPFCGSLPKSGTEFYEKYGEQITLAAVVECEKCGARKRVIFTASKEVTYVPFSDFDSAFIKVCNEWNRRVKE